MSERRVLIHTENVTRHYRLGDEVVKALDGITADVYEGEFLSIMGPSGSGKSTFFNMIGGLDRPTGGKIYMNGEDISKLSERQQARGERKRARENPLQEAQAENGARRARLPRAVPVIRCSSANNWS